MRILIDQVVYDQRNIGNVALLQTAVNRFSGLWPEATIEVLTEAPFSLRLYCPNVRPVSVFPSHNWSDQAGKNKKYLHELLPIQLIRILLELRENNALHWSGPIINSLRRKLFDAREDSQPPVSATPEKISRTETITSHLDSDLSQAVENADILVASGGGYMVNTFNPGRLYTVLERLGQGIRMNKPTVMVGQGVHRLRNPILVKKAKEVLPLIDYIFIREKVLAPKVLSELGVSPERVVMTGDDAVEMAYNARKPIWGHEIGVSLRVAIFTDVHIVDHIETIRSVLHEVANKYKSRLVALPISHDREEMDVEYIRNLINGYPNRSITWLKYESPLDIIKRIGHCRVVVTGAFHPAVFALSQGIPVVGIAKSRGYHAKFMGLADEFGAGCQIIDLNGAELKEKLAYALSIAWENAEQFRPHLLEVAERQTRIGKNAYRQIYDLFNSRNNQH